MKTSPAIGLFAWDPRTLLDRPGHPHLGALAEELGYDSLWVGDHVVLPTPRVDPSPAEPDEPMLDPLVALAFAAARTSRIRLGTGCVILPQRNPLVLAKQYASLDVLSGGRLIAGVAAGYLEPELRALGVPLGDRGARTDEYLRAMHSLWYDQRPELHGRYVDFAGVDAHPRPLQKPVPVVVGGHSAAAHRRAARYAHGWYGWMLSPRKAAEQIAALRALGADLEISVSPPFPPDEAAVRAYADVGVDRLIVVPPAGLAPDDLERFVVAQAPARVSA